MMSLKTMEKEKGRLKYRNIIILILICISILSGCSQMKLVDYTDFFTILGIVPVKNEIENMIEISYEISNLGKKDNLSFSVTIDGRTKTYAVNPNTVREDKVIIEIGKPNDYNLRYDIIYEVSSNGKTIWTKDDSITFDCKAMFVHPATIKYKGEIQQVELIDYQSNYYDLSKMFSAFNVNDAHNVILKNDLNEFAKIQKNENSEKGTNSAAIGSILRLSTYGEKEINDKYHFTDNLIIEIDDALAALSVNWNNCLEFSNDAKSRTSNVVGMTVTTFTFYINVENPSDEDVYGSIVKFYVNNKAISDEYMSTTSAAQCISSNSTGRLDYVTSGPVMRTTGVTNIERLGMEIILKDRNKNILYNDILWLELE